MQNPLIFQEKGPGNLISQNVSLTRLGTLVKQGDTCRATYLLFVYLFICFKAAEITGEWLVMRGWWDGFFK